MGAVFCNGRRHMSLAIPIGIVRGDMFIRPAIRLL